MSRKRVAAKERGDVGPPLGPTPVAGGAGDDTALPGHGERTEVGPVAAPSSQEARPAYNRIVARTVDDILKFGEWLVHQDGQEPLGIARWWRPHSAWELGVANKQASWLVLLEGSVEMHALTSILRQILYTPAGPKFVTRDLAQLVPWLEAGIVDDPLLKTPDEQKQALVDHFVGDLTSLAYTTGERIVSNTGFPSAVEDALDTFVCLPQLLVNCPSYYKAVALPNTKFAALGRITGRGQRFQITYEFLFLKVLAHLSGDPSLRWMLEQENVDPPGLLAVKLNLPREQVFPFLAWAALGSDTAAVLRVFPELEGGLPEKAHDYQRMTLDKLYPNIRRWVIEEEEEIRARRGCTSLYGRRYKGDDTTAALYHRVFGSVRDIIEVAKASLLRFPEIEVILESGARWWERVEIFGYANVDDPLFFNSALEHMSALAFPLGHPDRGGIPLKARVSIDA